MKNEKTKFADILYDAINRSNYSYEEVASMINLKSSREIYNYVNGIKMAINNKNVKINSII